MDAEHAEEADRNADLRAVRDHRLLRLAAAVGVEDVEREAMLLEDAGLVAKLGDEGLAHVAVADRDLEVVLRECGVGAEQQGEHAQRQNPATHRPLPSGFVVIGVAGACIPFNATHAPPLPDRHDSPPFSD